ncbi:twin transmembrane helix small protein [Roseomonas sp. KE0001]|uniref:twin transmembrane helix small protein n=1 Tax=unclassified Roseomonas TaxID=2617492 RepID=UPI0018DFFBC2|nr:twin transmembrane helix small protein [Roseomonas sp. KE0001]
MTVFLSILLGLSMLATLGVLFAGMAGLGRDGGAAAGARSNRLMRWRVVLQGLSIALFLALVWSMRG